MSAQLYMIPCTMGESPIERNLPQELIDTINSLKFFIVENIRTTRRFLKLVNRSIDIDSLTFFVLDKHTNPNDIPSFLEPLKEGHSIGMISEAGCPGVADPGAEIAKLAHQNNIRVIPMIGPSSILLSLMASGLNGQSFAFNGYLPVKSGEGAKQLKFLEERSIRENQTQIFIEAPYRNQRIMDEILATCRPQTRLCIACDITTEEEYIKTRTVAKWKGKLPEIHKRPAIFLILG